MLKSKFLLIARHKKIILITLILFVVVFSTTRKILSEKVNLWTEDVAEADCAVVLTGAPGRVREGFELLAQKKIKKLIVSGVYKEASLFEIFPYLPFYFEVDPHDVILEKRSTTTYGNAHQSVAIAEGLRCRDVILVTSQLHMSRAYQFFKVIFPENIELRKLTLPNSKSEQSFMDLTVEITKSLFYTALGLADRMEKMVSDIRF